MFHIIIRPFMNNLNRFVYISHYKLTNGFILEKKEILPSSSREIGFFLYLYFI